MRPGEMDAIQQEVKDSGPDTDCRAFMMILV